MTTQEEVKILANTVKSQEKEIEKLNSQLMHEHREAYRKGYVEGVRAFAWWKDGVEYVGTCGTTLKDHLKGIE